LLRMPSELRDGYGSDDRQGDEGSSAGDGVPEGRSARQGHREGERRGARQIPYWARDGAALDEELRSVQVAEALQADGPAEEVRQELQHHGTQLRQGRPGSHHR